MRIRHLALLFAFALSFHAEFAWAGGTDCVEMGAPAGESAHSQHQHGDHSSEPGEQDRAPECPTPTHHIAACSVTGVAATIAAAEASPISNQVALFRLDRLLDRLPTSLPTPPPWA